MIDPDLTGATADAHTLWPDPSAPSAHEVIVR